ncbi:MAG: 50S ribosomal protein L3 [Candidatus Kaiserbacteria bacterium]|nr:50S ribosomal protein L3 [Candidatus Kaiserbacteria bacterium]MCB9816671.1 50S ribosomal protein L3 [Candidatus Nomurabacteria bacterium]
MKFIVGTKTGMTQVFDAEGVCRAATVLKVTPATVSQVKTEEKDGYAAVQLAFGEQKDHRVNKATKGHFGASVAGAVEFRPREVYGETIDGVEKGATLDVTVFEPGDDISVSATSKGKGFQGVVKRHGFAGGRRSHGQKHSEREPGSIGATGNNRVLKGTRMAGRMGSDTVTVKGLKVLQVNAAENTLVVSGAVPGRKGTLVEVYGA